MTTKGVSAMEPPQSLPTKICKKCGHEWIPRVPNPQRCPKCLSRDWDKEEKMKEEDNKRWCFCLA